MNQFDITATKDSQYTQFSLLVPRNQNFQQREQIARLVSCILQKGDNCQMDRLTLHQIVGNIITYSIGEMEQKAELDLTQENRWKIDIKGKDHPDETDASSHLQEIEKDPTIAAIVWQNTANVAQGIWDLSYGLLGSGMSGIASAAMYPISKTAQLMTIDPVWRQNEKYRFILSQLRSHLTQEQDLSRIQSTDLKNALNALYHPDSFPSNRLAYDAFIKSLENGLLDPEVGNDLSSPESYEIHYLCYLLFTGVYVQDFTADITEKIALKGGYTKDDTELFSNLSTAGLLEDIPKILTRMDKISEGIKQSPYKTKANPVSQIGSKIRGAHSGFDFDPMGRDGNPPNVKFDLISNTSKKTPCVRSPSPTRGFNVHPLFLGYLNYLKFKGLNHMYINLQDRCTPDNKPTALKRYGSYLGFNNEFYRCHLLEELNFNEDYNDAVTVITLDKNSPFYHQTGSPEKMSREDFILEFVEQLISDNENFYLPKQFKNSRVINNLLNVVGNTIFNRKSELTLEDRKNFIEIAYIVLTLAFIRETDADFFNLSCKDCIDRGGGATWSLMTFVLLKEVLENPTRENLKRDLELLAVKFNEDALWARKRHAIDERRVRAKEALLQLIEDPEKLSKLFQELKRLKLLFFDTVSLQMGMGQITQDPDLQ